MSDQIKFFNDKPFYIMLLETSNIDILNLDWNNPNYVNNIISQSFIKSIEVDNTTFFSTIKEKLTLDPSKHLVTQLIHEEKEATYELIYIDNSLGQNTSLQVNQLATMLNPNTEVVHGNAILVKNYVSPLSSDIHFENMSSSELYKILRSRGYTKIVVWDENFREEEIYGDISIYAEKFFEGEKYNKLELAFLKHNLNIWYQKSEYGTSNLLGTLLPDKVEKILIFTMLTNEIRGNITKEEVLKISQLSKVLSVPFKPDEKWMTEEKDEHGRTIIKNKYRVLENVYHENIKS